VTDTQGPELPRLGQQDGQREHRHREQQHDHGATHVEKTDGLIEISRHRRAFGHDLRPIDGHARRPLDFCRRVLDFCCRNRHIERQSEYKRLLFLTRPEV
jgi:hypothetical protein